MMPDRQTTDNAGGAAGGLLLNANRAIRAIAALWLTQLVLRFGLAVPFWRYGVNKWDGFLQLNDVAVLLFSTEFKLHLPGGPNDFPAPSVMAFAAGSTEIVFPILLILGLATRFAALGLLAITLTVPDGWPLHMTWAAMALGIMAWGPGRISLDHCIGWQKG